MITWDGNVTDLTDRDASATRRRALRRHPVGMKLRDDDRFTLTRKGLDALQRLHEQRERADDVRAEVYGAGTWE